MNDQARYVLISACRNEAAYIGGLVDTVRAQSVPPLVWAIVDDGSTDATYELAQEFTRDLQFARVYRMVSGGPRSFASQVHAAHYGYEAVREMAFDFVGFLDADIRLPPSYYEALHAEFVRDPTVGLAGGALLDRDSDRTTYQRAGSERHHVPGGIQLFRRACFDAVGGYRAVEGGGQDSIADVMALMLGWQVRVYPWIKALHLRPEGAGASSPFLQGLAAGRKYYNLAYRLTYLIGHCVRRARRHPTASAGVLLGFLRATWRRAPRPVPLEFVQFQQRLQRERLTQAFLELFHRRKVRVAPERAGIPRP